MPRLHSVCRYVTEPINRNLLVSSGGPRLQEFTENIVDSDFRIFGFILVYNYL